MTPDSIITLTGTIVSFIAMLISIRQAWMAKNYRKEIRSDINKISLAKCTEKIERILTNLNDLPNSTSKVPRGFKMSDALKNINILLGDSIGVLSQIGIADKIRSNLIQTQEKLNIYEIKYYNGSLENDEVLEMKVLIQDAISISNTNLYNIG